MVQLPTVFGVTIDAPGTRDRDDAIWVERDPDGNWVLTVSIAAVAIHVGIGTPDDAIAAARGLNTYGEAGRASMLGSHVTSNMSSIDPRIPRTVVVERITFAPDFSVLSNHGFVARMRSLAAFSYPVFDDVLSLGSGRLQPMALAAVELARGLWLRRVRQVGMPDWESSFDQQGRTREGAPRGIMGKTVVHEFMLAHNAAATRAVMAAGLPMVFRNKGPRPGGAGGRYEVTCHGHDGLAEAAYGQFSSTMRRYVDLVNQRIRLSSHVPGSPAPYDQAELSRICADANLGAQMADMVNRAREAPGIHHGRASTDPCGASDITRRMQQGAMTHGDVAWALFSRQSPLVPAAKPTILERLIVTPGAVGRVWDCVRSGSGADHDCMVARAADGILWEASVAAGRHQASATDGDPFRAREFALGNLMAMALRMPSPCREARPLILADVDVFADLDDLCRVMCWEPPQFSTTVAGSGRDGTHASRVSVIAGEWDYRSPLCHGHSADMAEVTAAEQAYAALLPYSRGMTSIEVTSQGIDIDALATDGREVGAEAALRGFCIRYGATFRVVWWREIPSMMDFRCSVEVSSGTSVLSAPGQGTTREAAVTAASGNAVALVLGRSPWD